VIENLGNALTWYANAVQVTKSMRRIGQKHWTAMLDVESIWRDDTLHKWTKGDLVVNATTVINELDDLCVLLLFSVFEAAVRAHVKSTVDDALKQPTHLHPIVKHSLESLAKDVIHGGFYRIFEPFQRLNAGLAEQVNQIRRYRNWVAHGRRGAQPSSVEPLIAHRLLQSFLDLINASGAVVRVQVAAPAPAAGAAPVVPVAPHFPLGAPVDRNAVLK
jgi:hypothetical protein